MFAGVRAIYAIVCLMKMWVSVTTSSEVGNIIKQEHLQIESYTERLVNMFEAIVSRDAQSPHGKFYFVAKRLQDRFSQIKEGTERPDQHNPADEPRRAPAKTTAGKRSRQSSTNQTPLHLLSEVAMSNSGTPVSQPPQTMQTQPPQQQPPQAPMQQGWYAGAPAPQQPDMMGIPQGNFDPNFDFTQFDLSMGSDADLSALFIPDGVLWNFAPDPGMPYGGAF
jgi:hypothetical protein